jgi:glycosyltransferase involved in cell wall biosynthesis
LKVLMVGPYPRKAGHPRGGVEAVAENLVAGLSRFPQLQIEVIGIGEPGPVAPDDARVGGVTHVPCGPGLTGWYRDLHHTVVAEIRSRDYDIVHIQGIASLSSRLPGSILSVHGIAERDAWQSHRGVSRFARTATIAALEGVPRRRARHIIATSSYKSPTSNGRRRTVWPIPNAINPVHFDRTSPEAARRAKTFLYGGRITPLKNVAGLIASFSRVVREDRAAHLVIIGDGLESDYGRHCRTVAEQDRVVASSITFLESRSQREMSELLRSVGTLALFSRQENAPMIVAEALAAGTAVVATKVGAVQAMLSGLPGCATVRSGDEAGFARELLGRLNPRTEEASRLMQSAERYTPGVVAEKTIAAYTEALSARGDRDTG